MTPPSPNPCQKIGIMADSHGQSKSLMRALTFFRNSGCKAIYHLGDLCDSAHPETADHCVSLLQENNVFGIKGNNDHQVVVNHEGRQQSFLAWTTIQYLKNLPMIIEREAVVMAHSLPFVDERGLSSMVGVLDHNEAALFFQNYPGKLLFRGHSHYPEILRKQKHAFLSNKISPGEIIQLAEIKPCIITCGALDEGFLMTWEPGRKTIACHKLALSDKP